MKLVLLIHILLLLYIGTLMAQNIEGSYQGNVNPYVGDTMQPISYGSFSLAKDKYEFYVTAENPGEERLGIPEIYFDNYDTYSEEGTYTHTKEGIYDYLYLKNATSFNYKHKLGFLFHPRRFYLYDENTLFFASDEGVRWSGYDPKITEIKVSSFLVEKNTRYDAYNFRLPWKYYLRPWVEGVAGDGIGEWIEFTLERYIDSSPALSSRPLDYFLFSNGYVSFINPALYQWNNRVKKLRVICETENIDFVVELEDTPQFQEIRLPRSLTPKKCVFRFVIEEVYKGARWDDTCINLIMPIGEGIQPR